MFNLKNLFKKDNILNKEEGRITKLKYIKDEMIDEEGVSWDNGEECFWIKGLGFCGCSDYYIFDMACAIFLRICECHVDRVHFYYNYYTKTKDLHLCELILHSLYREGLADHGSSVRGCWLSEKGEKLAKECIIDFELILSQRFKVN